MERYVSPCLVLMGRPRHLKLVKVKYFLYPLGIFTIWRILIRIIGIVGGFSTYSNEVLGSIFNKDPKFFGNLPRLDKNVFIASGTG
jgi:hypothetical protein